MPISNKESNKYRARLASKSGNRKRDFYKRSLSPTPEPDTHHLDFNIGIEIECLPRLDNGGKDGTSVARQKRYTIMEHDMQSYLRNDPVMKVHDYNDPLILNHQIWALKYDGTVQGKSHHDNTCPVEIISPILEDLNEHAGEIWEPIVRRIFEALDYRGGVSTNTSCGTHVHLSPRSAKWSLEDLQKLSCCVLFFEPAFEVLYPEAHRDHHMPTVTSWIEAYTKSALEDKRAQYAKANGMDNPNFALRKYEDNVDLIYKTKTFSQLTLLMNPPQRGYNNDSIYDRYFAWNFGNLRENGKFTVEYRRPPGVQSFNACINWVRLAITFVRAAMRVNNPHCPLQGTSVSDVHVYDLLRFLKTGLPENQDMDTYFGTFFKNKQGSLKVIPVKERATEDEYDIDEE